MKLEAPLLKDWWALSCLWLGGMDSSAITVTMWQEKKAPHFWCLHCQTLWPSSWQVNTYGRENHRVSKEKVLFLTKPPSYSRPIRRGWEYPTSLASCWSSLTSRDAWRASVRLFNQSSQTEAQTASVYLENGKP